MNLACRVIRSYGEEEDSNHREAHHAQCKSAGKRPVTLKNFKYLEQRMTNRRGGGWTVDGAKLWKLLFH